MPVYYESRKNKRRMNQDSHLYVEYRINHEALIRAMVIADGMGGLACGELASELAAQKWILKLQEMTLSKEFLGRTLNEQIENLKRFSVSVIQEINEEVYQELTNRGVTGGTTLTTAILYWDTLIFSNCGDSPAYYYKKQEHSFCKISRDQNAAEEMVLEGRVKKYSKEYWKHKNMLTDYIGKYRQSNPYTCSISFDKGDCLLLGSDGAFGKLLENEIGKIVNDFYDMPDRMIKEIMAAAEKQGEEDNQTLLCYMEEKAEEISKKEKRGFFRKRQAVKSCIL